MSVLVIDDDQDTRDTIASILSDHFDPPILGICMSSAFDALVYLTTLGPGCVLPLAIILDLRMPNLDGFEFRRRLLGDPLIASIPVIAMSASRATRLNDACELRPAVFLDKPFDLDTLLEAVTRVTGG